MSKNALGRGFESLIPIDLNIGDVAEPGEHIRRLDISLLVPNPEQPRKEFDQDSLEELAISIKQYGIIQPIIATPFGDKYRIVAGERRYRAALIAKLKKVPVIVRNHEVLEELEIALVENVQRVDLSPIEQAVSIVRLRDQFSLSLREIAKKLGKAETTVNNIVRLLQLPKGAVEALVKNIISEGHARAILSLKGSEAKQTELLRLIVDKSISVREAEAFAKNAKRQMLQNEQKSSSVKFSDRLGIVKKNKGFDISVAERKRGGIVTIRYRDDTELDSIISFFE